VAELLITCILNSAVLKKDKFKVLATLNQQKGIKDFWSTILYLCSNFHAKVPDQKQNWNLHTDEDQFTKCWKETQKPCFTVPNSIYGPVLHIITLHLLKWSWRKWEIRCKIINLNMKEYDKYLRHICRMNRFTEFW